VTTLILLCDKKADETIFRYGRKACRVSGRATPSQIADAAMVLGATEPNRGAA